MEQDKAYNCLESVLNAVCNGEIKSSELLKDIRENAHRCKQAVLVEIAIDWLKIAAHDYKTGNFDPRNEKQFEKANHIIRGLCWGIGQAVDMPEEERCAVHKGLVEFFQTDEFTYCI